MPILIFLALLCLAGVFALGRTMSGRLGSVGWTLVVAAVINTIAAFSFWALVASGGVLRMFPHSGPEGDLAVSVIRAVQQAIFADYLTIELIASGILLLVGVALVIASKFAIPKKVETAAPTPATPETKQAMTEAKPAETMAPATPEVAPQTEAATSTSDETKEPSSTGAAAIGETPVSED
jgi:hypothetical protein